MYMFLIVSCSGVVGRAARRALPATPAVPRAFPLPPGRTAGPCAAVESLSKTRQEASEDAKGFE